MKKDCEVVRDLMPLVLDDVASDGSKHMVSTHVQTCAQCAAYMNQLKADLPAGRKASWIRAPRSTPPPRRCGSRSAAAPSAISCWVR